MTSGEAVLSAVVGAVVGALEAVAQRPVILMAAEEWLPVDPVQWLGVAVEDELDAALPAVLVEVTAFAGSEDEAVALLDRAWGLVRRGSSGDWLLPLTVTGAAAVVVLRAPVPDRWCRPVLTSSGIWAVTFGARLIVAVL